MSTKRGKADNGATTRDGILTLAARLFAKNGYKATNLQAVAEELDVTRQALYYHFRSKGDILAALFDDVMSRMEQAADAVSGEDDADLFVAMLRAHIDVIVANIDLVAVLLHERAEISKLNGLNAARRRQAYNMRFIAAYERGVQAGRLRDLDPWTVTNMLLSSANATSTWFRGRDRRRLSASQAAESVFDVLVGGILLADQAPAATTGS
jgi:AcrR family transcriptional regulator